MNDVKHKSPLIILEAAIEGISYSISQIDRLDGLDNLSGPTFVDLAARLNAQSLFLDKTLDPMKDRIKAQALASGENSVKGKAYQATITTITKSVLDTQKVKAFLGRKLAQFMKERDEVHLVFSVKE